ncbi:DUF3488 domain-containing protein [Deinococcus irradiatisoli]|uniref:DUF3488 domain-containing protein n=1 Tax=Deinococcus irradiatisoli TaxID=2202254 RepID=A0A2Z3JED9_9DEIO|nr:DUF3488 and transglutaminase-like domain-containing protein [Deinococcus irradiatisoli]AWN21831.1 DUF3488 domain-containing protein [Deinococcus irradiatisoli]
MTSLPLTLPGLGRRPRPAGPSAAPLPVATLLLLLAALLLCMLPYAARMPVWASALVLALLVYRAALGLGRAPALPLLTQSLTLVLIVLGAGWGLLQTFGTLLGRDGGTAVLVVLLALKAVETRSGRDLQMLALLGFFLTVTHFFYAQDTLTAVHALLSILALCAALACWERPGALAGATGPAFKAARLSLLRPSAMLLLQALPLAAALFVLFPRPDSPLWQLPVSGAQNTSGLSDTVNPGGISSLALSDAVAFRAQFDGPVPAPSHLYWRGPVMEFFDGEAWRIGAVSRQFPEVMARGPVENYTLTVEPHDRAWVLALDAPASLPAGTRITQNLQVIKPSLVGTRTRFKLSAATEYTYGLNADPDWLSRNLQLPERANPRLRELARGWLNLPPLERVKAGLNVFRQGDFAYTLNPPTLPSVNGMDAFVFQTRRGFCEHYASAFAFMMRAAGVPARVVTGYQGAEDNGNYLIVRQANAHAWTEVWLAGQGWLRVDPTATVSPDRIEEGVSALRGAPGLAAGAGGWLGRLSLKLDVLQNLWNTWVIGYDGAQQRQLFEKLGLGELGGWKITLFGSVLVLLGFAPLLLRRRQQAEPLSAAYALLTRRLGVPRPAQEPASVYAERATRRYPQQAEQIQTLIGEYQRLRYGPDAPVEAVRAFVQRVRAFKPRSGGRR